MSELSTWAQSASVQYPPIPTHDEEYSAGTRGDKQDSIEFLRILMVRQTLGGFWYETAGTVRLACAAVSVRA